MPVEFKREELYTEVWQTPLTKLGEKYGLSDNGIRKICKAMKIPLPSAGHWAKVAVGKRVYQPPLPAKADLTTYLSHPPPKQERFAEPEDAPWLAQRIAFEDQPDNQIVVEPAPSRWHPVVRPHRDRIRAEAKKLLASKKANERYEKLSDRLRGIQSNSEGSYWASREDRGQRVGNDRGRTVIAASLGAYERALAILNAIASAATVRGFDLCDSPSGEVMLVGHQAEIRLRITEQLERKTRQRRRYDGAMEAQNYLVPTGRLRITLDESRTFEDSERGKLDSMLNRVFIAIHRQVVQCWHRARAAEIRRREWEESERRRAEAERLRLERERKVAEEQKRRNALLAEASQWLEARKIRAYVRHIDAQARALAVEQTAALKEWKDWALAVAQDLDRTEARIAGAR